MSTGTWVKADNGAQLPGETYRARMSLRAPYTVENIERLEAEFRRQARANGSIVVDSFVVTYPKKGVWTATATYHIGNTPQAHSFGVVLDTIGTLCQDVVGFVISNTGLILTTVEKFVVETVSGVVSGVVDPLTKPIHEVLNPGVLILVVVGIFLVTRKG